MIVNDDNTNKLFWELLLKYDNRHVIWQEMFGLDIKKYDCKRLVFCYGGSGSAKSYSIQQYIIFDCIINKRKWLGVRKTATSLNLSMVSTFKTILKQFDINYKYLKQEKTFIFENGSSIHLIGCDDEERIKGIEGFNCIFIDEVTELSMNELQQFNLRLRGKEGDNGQIFCAFNPISTGHYLYVEYYQKWFQGERDDCIFIHSTYKNNKFLSENYVDKFKHLSENYKKIYIDGEFGRIQNGLEFYHNFSSKHINDNINYNNNEPLYLSFDENVSPFCAVVIAQKNGKYLNIIDECALFGKNIIDVCKHISLKYYNHNNIIYVTGDASGLSRSARGERNQNFYTIILDNLKNFNVKLDVPSSNENVVMRSLWINKILETDEITVRVSKNCKKFIYDIENVERAEDGSKAKKRGKIDNTDITCELFGHHTDCFDYLITRLYKNEYQLFRKSGIKNPFIGIGRTY